MTPFSHDLDQNDLIAYHLQELSPRRQRALRRALQHDAALAAESEAIAATLRAFPKQEPSPPVDTATLDRNWLALLPSLVVHFPQPRTPRSLFGKRHLLAYAGIAFAAIALVVSLNLHQRHEQPSTLTTAETSSSLATNLPPTDTTATANNAPSFDSSLQAFPQIPRRPHRTSPAISPFASVLPDTAETSSTAQTPPSVLLPTPLTSTSPIPSSPATIASNTINPALPSPATTPPSAVGSRILKPHRSHPADFTLAMFGNLAISPSTSSTSGTGTSLVTTSLLQTATPAVGALASFHQQFSPWLGYRITTTYSRPSFENTVQTSTYTEESSSGRIINQRIYELSGTYAVQGPHRGRLSTSAEAGGSLLAFLFTDGYQLPTTNGHAIRAAGVVGVGSELTLSKHWALHAEYRAQLYKPPAFYTTNSSPTPGNITFSSNPIFGITYRFGSKGVD